MADGRSIIRDLEVRRGIIASIVASIIVIILIQPLLRLIWAFVLRISTRFIQNNVDSIYRNAALGHRDYVDVLLLMTLFSVLCGSLLGLGISLTKRVVRPAAEPKKSGKRRLWHTWTSIAFLHVIAVVCIIRPFTNLQYNASFQQRLKVLAPKIDDLEFKQIEAAWASMQSRQDYLAIKARMEALAEQHSLTLPRVLLR